VGTVSLVSPGTSRQSATDFGGISRAGSGSAVTRERSRRTPAASSPAMARTRSSGERQAVSSDRTWQYPFHWRSPGRDRVGGVCQRVQGGSKSVGDCRSRRRLRICGRVPQRAMLANACAGDSERHPEGERAGGRGLADLGRRKPGPVKRDERSSVFPRKAGHRPVALRARGAKLQDRTARRDPARPWRPDCQGRKPCGGRRPCRALPGRPPPSRIPATATPARRRWRGNV
jgi:hypothetical protein